VAREAPSVFASLVDRRYEDEMKIGDYLNVTPISNLTARTKTKASNAAITYETITETNVQINVATWEYSAIATETIVGLQAKMDLMEKYAPKNGYALAVAVETALAGLIDDFTQNVGTLAVGLDYTKYVRARQYLLDAKADVTQAAFVVSPAEEANLLDMDKVVNNDYSSVHGDSPRDTGLKMAYSRSLLRIPVYVTTFVEGTNAAGHDNGLFHREAIALVMQKKPTTHTFFDIDYFVNKVAVEQIYGYKEMRDDHGVWMKGA